jgi:hypothetical protein
MNGNVKIANFMAVQCSGVWSKVKGKCEAQCVHQEYYFWLRLHVRLSSLDERPG